MVEFETRTVEPANALTTPSEPFVISHLSKSTWIEPPVLALLRMAVAERLKSESRATTLSVLEPSEPVNASIPAEVSAAKRQSSTTAFVWERTIAPLVFGEREIPISRDWKTQFLKWYVPPPMTSAPNLKRVNAQSSATNLIPAARTASCVTPCPSKIRLRNVRI